MERRREKFTIQTTERGVDILSGDGKSLQFTALEALMLLDILLNEESRLKQMAEEASSSPMKIKL